MKARKFCIIALVLAMIMLITPISESKVEEEPEVKKSGDYEYIVLDDETACIKQYNGEDEELIIPEKIDEIRVTGIGDYVFLGKTNLKEITISDSVESIGINPFAQCKNLLNINISPNHPTLFFLDNVLFYKPEKKIVSYLCASEKSKYEIPKGIKIIGDSAFSGCKNLEKINIPDSVQLIGDSAFAFCDKIKEITIPDSVQSIGNAAFSFCKNLTKIKLPDSLQFIGDSAFSICENLEGINIPDRVKSIGDNAFYGCYNLKKINIPDRVKSIGDSAFSSCESLEEIYISDDVQSIGDNAFAFCDKITEITIPDSVEKIGGNPFYGCTNLLNIEISDNHPILEFIDNALIYKPEKKLVIYLSTSKESKYEIPKEIEIIGDIAFYGCKNLKEINIPDGVQLLGDKAFEGCTNLDEIKIPDNVQSIGFNAFFRCINLKKINIPESVKTIGKDAFEDCDNLTVTVEKGSFAEEYCKENNVKYMYEDSLKN